MRSETSKRIQSETTSETKDKALNYAKEVIMKTKLEEAAGAHYNNPDGLPDRGEKQNCIDDFIAGAQWQQEHSKEAIEELVKALENIKDLVENTNPLLTQWEAYKDAEEIIKKYKQ